MKYYKLKKDLPTFKKGELFYMDDSGSLARVKDDLMVYYYKTIKKFPSILEDWFAEVPAPVRDGKTKQAFIEYLNSHEYERFFQAIRNFAQLYLGDEFNFIYASKREQEYYKQHYDKFEDTFYMECDDMLKEEE